MSNVIVKSDRYTVEPLYQWDLNQILTIYGLSLGFIPEIHFTNNYMDRSIVRQATMNDAGVIAADIPNSLLQKPHKITAYVCIYEGDTFKTLYAIEIPVKARRKPNDYTLEVTDDEIYSFNALENLVNNTLVTLTADNKKLIEDVTKKCDETVNNVKKSNAQLQAELDQKYDNAMRSCEQNFETQEQNFADDVEALTRTVNARVDNIIAHNNDINGNTELSDIRTGANGIVYGSAGSAVREQIGELNNLLNYSGIIKQYTLNPVPEGDAVILEPFSIFASDFNDNGRVIIHYPNGNGTRGFYYIIYHKDLSYDEYTIESDDSEVRYVTKELEISDDIFEIVIYSIENYPIFVTCLSEHNFVKLETEMSELTERVLNLEKGSLPSAEEVEF